MRAHRMAFRRFFMAEMLQSDAENACWIGLNSGQKFRYSVKNDGIKPVATNPATVIGPRFSAVAKKYDRGFAATIAQSRTHPAESKKSLTGNWTNPLTELGLSLAETKSSVRTSSSRYRSSPRGPLRLLGRGVDGDLGAAARRGASLGPADGPHLPAHSSSAEELIAAIGLEPRNVHSGRHLKPLQALARSGIASPQIALVTFPGGVPELAVDPGDPGHEAVGLDSAKNRRRLRIDLMDLPVLILSHPERPFGPGEPRVITALGRGNGGEDKPGLRIDLLDATLSDLKQVLDVESCSCMRGHIDRAQHLAARRIEGIQRVFGRKPDLLTVKRDPIHAVDSRKGSILTDDFSR